VAQDSTKVQVRKPNDTQIVALRKLRDYQYGTEQVSHVETWWKRLLRAFFKWFSEAFSGAGNPTFWKYFAYLFVAFVVVFVSLKLIGVNFEGFLGKKTNNTIPYETIVEDIHQIDFNQSIVEAIEQKNYRLAVRLYYLKTLKELSDSGLIHWQINKTNQSYVYELEASNLDKAFEQVTRQFEYTWYGDFPIDEQHFFQIRGEFLKFSNQIIKYDYFSKS
jgi:Domain of unknown function (DUF4129)